MNLKNKKILITGSDGFLGRYVVEEFIKNGIPKQNLFLYKKSKFDYRKAQDCKRAVRSMDVVIHLAAMVGGIGLNIKKPGELFYDNLIMGVQLMEEARKAKVEKFVALGTVCAYPKDTPIPFKEADLWKGYPESTNAPYGLAKKMLLVQSQSYRKQYGFNSIYLLPVNLYGPGDSFNEGRSHVIPALIKKIVEAHNSGQKKVDVWGDGSATREFLYVKDAARAIFLATKKYSKSDPVNIGSGKEISIKNLVKLISSKVGLGGEIVWDKTKPNGQPRRMLDTSKAYKEFGFKSKVGFEEGLSETIKWFNEQ
ncbi:GDP-L-fucose synthase [Candidatus Microgenomates bacterium]|nr:GDP-L-fucose synthase [Candidatus Microgenomates bacterium]